MGAECQPKTRNKTHSIRDVADTNKMNWDRTKTGAYYTVNTQKGKGEGGGDTITQQKT